MAHKIAPSKLEYEKDRNLNKEEVTTLMEWVEQQPHLPEITVDRVETQAILFLQSCHFDQSQAKQSLDDYFTIRTLCPEIYDTPSLEIIQRVAQVGSRLVIIANRFMSILPKKTPKGYDILLMRNIDPNPRNYDHCNQTRVVDLVLTSHYHMNGTSQGLLILIDLEGGSLGHVARVNLGVLKKHLHFVQCALPVRLQGLHYVNIVPFMDKLMGLVKPFMEADLYQKIHIHKNLESLYEHVPRDCLPEELGGEAPSVKILHDENFEGIVRNMDFFHWHNSQKVNENLRPGGKPKTQRDIFGSSCIIS